ncbi:mechanosensitive ion channel protein 8-like [Morus notabilis]|uniref:mechanosensitive ion channel protein 8-like n=1 Tax=Morus notabilis TaxID=981085 RepID=UPI000CECE78F|nr:mechanosensitive ion channel protein 8-like [Morus notabilis]
MGLKQILPYVTKILVCFLVGTLVCLLKTLLVKVLALSFHVNNFFERIQEALFNQYVIETLSGRPISLERHEAREFQSAGAAMPRELRATLLPRNDCPFPSFNRSPTFSRHASERHDKKIPIEYLHKLNPKNISAWSMKRMMRTIGNGSLTTLDERILNLDTDDESSLQIKTICQAKEAAKKIFSRVAKPRFEYVTMPFFRLKIICNLMDDLQDGVGVNVESDSTTASAAATGDAPIALELEADVEPEANSKNSTSISKRKRKHTSVV